MVALDWIHFGNIGNHFFNSGKSNLPIELEVLDIIKLTLKGIKNIGSSTNGNQIEHTSMWIEILLW